MTQRFNPYNDLKRRFSEFASACASRQTRAMWTYPKAKLAEGWRLCDLWERVAAAEQLGFDVQLAAKEDGLTVTYVKKMPQRPYDV